MPPIQASLDFTRAGPRRECIGVRMQEAVRGSRIARNSRQRIAEWEGSLCNFFTLSPLWTSDDTNLAFTFQREVARRRRWRRAARTEFSSLRQSPEETPPRLLWTSGTRLAARSRNYVVDIMQIRARHRERSAIKRATLATIACARLENLFDGFSVNLRFSFAS